MPTSQPLCCAVVLLCMACRFQACLSTSSIQLLAAAVSTGCSSLQELDLSCNLFGAAPSLSLQCSSEGASTQADQAWACLIQALVQPCCQQLQALVLSQCDLGPAAAAVLSRLLRAKSRSAMQRLQLAHCSGMGEVSHFNAVAGPGLGIFLDKEPLAA